MTTTTKYMVTVRGFDRIRTFPVVAESEDEAREKALAECWITVEIKPAVDIEQQIALAREEEQ